jgi:DNA-directed RNA polymerase specialized sigma24 family protein
MKSKNKIRKTCPGKGQRRPQNRSGGRRGKVAKPSQDRGSCRFVVNSAPGFTAEEEQQFAALDREHRPWAMAIAEQKWGTRINVAAAVNSALCKAMLRFDPARGVKFRCFLAFILHCELVSAWRQECKYCALFVPLSDHFDAVDEAAGSPTAFGELQEWLESALSQLSDEDRRLIYLRYEKELNFEEISKLL